MSTTATYAPLPAALPTTQPAPDRSNDVFDFLYSKPTKVSPEEQVTAEYQTNDLVAVTIRSTDGRMLSRRVPASSWKEDSYRTALIRSMSLLVA